MKNNLGYWTVKILIVHSIILLSALDKHIV